jgi:hypothetical protein
MASRRLDSAMAIHRTSVDLIEDSPIARRMTYFVGQTSGATLILDSIIVFCHVRYHSKIAPSVVSKSKRVQAQMKSICDGMCVKYRCLVTCLLKKIISALNKFIHNQ